VEGNDRRWIQTWSIRIVFTESEYGAEQRKDCIRHCFNLAAEKKITLPGAPID